MGESMSFMLKNFKRHLPVQPEVHGIFLGLEGFHWGVRIAGASCMMNSTGKAGYVPNGFPIFTFTCCSQRVLIMNADSS